MKREINVFLAFALLAFFIASCNTGTDSEATKGPKVAKLNLPEGFHAEYLYSPKEHNQGSWVAMTFDDKGRMITSDQYGNLYRITLPPIGYDTAKMDVKVEKLPIKIPNDTFPAKIKIGYAHGLLYAFNSLYVMVNDEGDADTVTRESGLYRLQDTNNDDTYDKLTLLKALDGQGEHGPHSPVLGPDGKSIYIIAGNFTELPKMKSYYLPPIWQEDNLLPLLYDPRGFGNSTKPPGGWIAKINPDGSNWTLVSAGFRNPFDMAFNEDEELFTFDSDMEWDLGLPWYRPTRICHVTKGSNFGYRENNHKWRPSYPDNLPAVLNVGQGSPTNVMSGADARFPEKYRRGLFTFDWSYGIIYHINLISNGSSYKAEAKEFVSGAPLPLTDGAIGPDGAMYFLTGGRKLESDLYRVYYEDGDMDITPLDIDEPDNVLHARALRKKLEKYQLHPNPSAIDFAWSHLNDEDRFIRYAARMVIEHQPVEKWKQKAFSETDPIISIHSMLALARNGDKSLLHQILSKLTAINYEELSSGQKIDLLRTIEVTLSRMGKPEGAIKEQVIAYLAPNFPAPKGTINRLFSKILVYIGDPEATQELVSLLYEPPKKKADQNMATQSSDLIFRNAKYGLDIADMLANMPPAQHIYYAVVLSAATEGWTSALRKKYFEWFYKAFDEYKGGHSYVGYINEARKKALAHVPEKLYARYNTLSGDSLLTNSGDDLASAIPGPKGPGKDWEIDSVLALIKDGLKNRNFENGKNMFLSIHCGKCHRSGSIGAGDVGPDLSQLGTRFSNKDILKAIIEPSESISSQYGATVFYLENGSSVMGKLVRTQEDKYYVSQNPFAPLKLREIPKDKVVETKDANVSIMPPGLINSLNPDELKDLLAFLKSGGNENNKMFKSENKKDVE